MKSFTESGVLFPDDWENEPEEPAVPPPAPEPKPERKVRDTAARPAPKLASEDEDLDYGTPCFKRADLVDLLCEEHGVDVAESRAFVAEFFDMIFDHLVQGHMVKLSGLGRFSVRYKAPRPARNPWTGETVMLEERTVVCYQSSDTLNTRVTAKLREKKKG